jgi:8-oxo-dGTP pyrophosphatase MutT (NUDIX family)
MQKKIVYAAGGIVIRKKPEKTEILVIHRPKYDDWSLPKGKLEPGESWENAAIREVYEETACSVHMMNFAGPVLYPVNNYLKLVLFWYMQPSKENKFEPSREVDQILWVSPQRALKILDHEREQNLIKTGFF